VTISRLDEKNDGEKKHASRFDAKVISKAVLAIVASVPSTTERPEVHPRERAHRIRTAAALKAAAVSGSMALPAGPWALATILPDLFAVWRIQAQMVADISGVYGKAGSLSQEEMLYCLFKHAAAQVVRDLVSRVGERIVFRRATLKALHKLARRLGSRVSQRMLAQSMSRWIPVLGSASVAGYAFFDTKRVGTTAIDLFEEVFGERGRGGFS
jgi:hypothetical protein